MTMLVNIDLEGVLEQAEALPETTATLDGIAPGLRPHYSERDGKFHLDGEWRAEFVEHPKDALDRNRVRTQARSLDELQKRQGVVKEVRSQLAKQVAPEMLRAATADFMAQHKFAFRGNRVPIVGKLGEMDAELAAITWATDSGEPFIQRRAAPDSTFTAAMSKMRLH
jgi:hypothetical protein